MSARNYTLEFKQEAVKLVLEKGLSRSQVAQSLGMDDNTLRAWIKRYGPAQDEAGTVAPVALEEQMRRLQRRVNELTMERDILKKAIGIFSQMPKL